MYILKLPSRFMTLLGLHSMMLLVFPSLHSYINKMDSVYSELLVSYKDIVVSFYDVFKDNNIEKREQFFANPLIQWLWNFSFVQMRPELLIEHLRRTRSYPFEGEARFRALMLDISLIEMKFSLKLMPA